MLLGFARSSLAKLRQAQDDREWGLMFVLGVLGMGIYVGSGMTGSGGVFLARDGGGGNLCLARCGRGGFGFAKNNAKNDSTSGMKCCRFFLKRL